MAVYLGGKKWSVNLNGVKYNVRTLFKNANVLGYGLMTSDNCFLQDSNGLYLTTTGYGLLSGDNAILQDSNRLNLTVKETDNYGQ